MVRIFYKHGKQVMKETDVRELGLLKNLMWVDLQSATSDEEEWVETKCNISLLTVFLCCFLLESYKVKLILYII